jgi:opacity protein-like surface antigen
VEVAAAQFRADGERAFVGPNDEVFKLGIPVEITVTPIEITGGWRWRRWNRLVPYGGGGFSSYRYRETSDFADPDEDVDERFNGFHVLGGAEYRALDWLAVGGEVAWSSIPDAIGNAGVSAVFNEDNLGGTSLRLKISVGR